MIDSRAPRFNQTVIGLAVGARDRHRLVVAPRAARAAARARADARPALLPAVPRVLRARPAALRRGPARGLAPAARREHGRLRRPHGRLARLRSPASTRSASRSALLVAALALLAAITGFCTGCEAYKLALPAHRQAVRLLPAARRGRHDLAVLLAGLRRRPPRRDDRNGRRQPDDADPDPALRLQREGRGRHRHPPRRDLQVVRRGAPPDARHGPRPARDVDARRARRRSR